MRLNRQATTTPGASGTGTINFPETPVDRVWTGTITVPAASTSAVWSLQLAGQTIQTVYGQGPFGPIQSLPGETISLVGSSLTPLVQLIGILIGDDDSYPGPPYEGPLASTPVAVTPAGTINVDIVGPVDGSGNVLVDIAATEATVPVAPQPQLPRAEFTAGIQTIGSGTQTMVLVEAGTKKAYITAVEVTLGGAASGTALHIQLYRYATGGSAPVGTPFTGNELDSSSAATSVSGLIVLSGEPTTTKVPLGDWELQPFGGGVLRTYRIEAEECPVLNTTDGGIGLQVVSAPGGTSVPAAFSLTVAGG